MILRLKAGIKFAPSGLPFTDVRTGATFDGYERSITGAVDMIIEHRQRNPQHYPPNEAQWFEQASVRQEFYRQLFPSRPDMFVQVPDNPPPPLDPQTCHACGSHEINQIECPTCGQGKVISRTCGICGAKQRI